MGTTSFTSVRRISGIAITLLLFCLCLSKIASGQGLVTASSAVGLSHPTGWKAIQQTAIDSNGDWLVPDYQNDAVYEFPVGGGAAIVLGAGDTSSTPGVLGSGYGPGANPGILIDPANNLYLEVNYNNCIIMFPWDAATQTWTNLNMLTPANPAISMCTNSGKNNESEVFAQYGIGGYSQGYFQPQGLAIGNNNNMIIGTENSGNFIMDLGVTGAWSAPVAGSVVSEPLSGMTKAAISVAQDPAGNIYLVEGSGGLPGVYEITAAQVAAAAANSANQLTADAGLPRIDPNLPAVTGIITDAQGNLYVSDSTVGVVFIPNPAGTPQTASSVVLTSVPAQGEVAIDWTRNYMYVPTTQTQSNGQGDVAKLSFGYGEFGSSPVGTAAAAGANVVFGFNGPVTPAKFTIVEAGVTKPDFAITGGTCTTGTAYAAMSGCLQNVTFTPKSVGNISAKLLMLDGSGNVLSSMMLHGTGIGANMQVAPGVESTFGSGLMTPTQVATDALQNVYVADPAAGKVLEFAAGKSTSIGTGLTAPTGVAVDGAGDVFIADSGNVYEVPFGASGLNAAGQVTLVSGLGANLNLAVDGLDNLYIADPSNKRVVKLSNVSASTGIFAQSEIILTAGFNAPSAVAVDANNNLYVIDGANLFELIGGTGTPTSLVDNLSGATGLAIDPSGAVYLTSTSTTQRIPLVSGSLVPADETTIAGDVSNVSSVALDRAGNVYLTGTAGGSITLVSPNGTLTLASPTSLTSSTSATAIVTNTGNNPLSITGYSSTNAVDFTAADGTCVGDSTSPATGIAAGGTCVVDVTFNPGAGEQGALQAQIQLASNAINAPIVINANGVGLNLGGSGTTVTISTSEVINTPVTVTVAPAAGSGTPPSGVVTITYPTWTVVIPGSGANAGVPQINPTTATATATLTNGKATFSLAPVLAGPQSFSVAYSGDRTYGRSTGTATVTVAKSAIAGIALPTFPAPSDINLPFVVPGTGGGTVPYDGSEDPWQYKFNMNVNTAFGVPTGTITVMDNSSTCPAGTSASGIGAATCILINYSGVACPNGTSGVITVANAGTTTGAQAQFNTSCLWSVPTGTTYSPVIFTHYITPVYSGDANFLGTTGPTPTLLQAVRGPAVLITQTGISASSTTAPTLSVAAGSSASMNLTITPILGYGIAGGQNPTQGALNDSNFPVSLTCDIPIPHAQCTFSYAATNNPNQIVVPNSVQIPCPAGASTTDIADGSVQCTPGQATVTIYTDVSTGTTVSQNARAASVALGAFFGLGMIGLFVRRRAFEKARGNLMVLMMIVGVSLAVSLTACSTANLSPQSALATPAGTYAVTITAQEVGTQCVPFVGPTSNCTTASGGQGALIYASGNQVSIPFYINVTVQ